MKNAQKEECTDAHSGPQKYAALSPIDYFPSSHLKSKNWQVIWSTETSAMSKARCLTNKWSSLCLFLCQTQPYRE